VIKAEKKAQRESEEVLEFLSDRVEQAEQATRQLEQKLNETISDKIAEIKARLARAAAPPQEPITARTATPSPVTLRASPQGTLNFVTSPPMFWRDLFTLVRRWLKNMRGNDSTQFGYAFKAIRDIIRQSPYSSQIVTVKNYRGDGLHSDFVSALLYEHIEQELDKIETLEERN
jgi:hypothetical protein